MSIEQSLQIVLQEPAAIVAVLVVLTGGLVGMGIRNIVDAVVVDESDTEQASEDTDSLQYESADAAQPDSDASTLSSETTDSVDSRQTDSIDGQRGTDATPAALESRLDTLETEVDSLSTTVDSVRNENEVISESVEEVEANTGRLVRLFRRATQSASAEVNETSARSETLAESGTSAPAKRDDGNDEKTEAVEADATAGDVGTAAGDESPSPGLREKHCVDSDEEIIETPGLGESETTDESSSVTEEVEEIGVGTFEGTRFSSPKTTDETFGTEETISTPSVASDGGTAVATDSTVSQEAKAVAAAAPSISNQETEPERDAETEPDVEPEIEPERHAETETASNTEPEPNSEQIEETPPSPTETLSDDDQHTPAFESAPSAEEATSGKPYLDELPEGFTAEVLTVEWLEYLVAELGVHGTARAINYYESIGWLTEETGEELDDYLDAYEDGDREPLSVEHHTTSLEYVDELTTINEP